MNRQNRLTSIAAAVILIFTSSPAFSQMADGSYNHDFSGEVLLWDLSGGYSDPDDGLEFTLIEGSSGALTGSGTFHIDDSGIVLDSSSMAITGKVKTSGTHARASMKFLIYGTGTVYGEPVSFTATITSNSDIEPAAGQLVLINGRLTIKVRSLLTGRRGGNSGKLNPGGTQDLPVDSTGDWNLTLNLVPFNSKKYDATASTATVETSTGNTTDLTATGSYASKTDTSKITLKGPKGTGASLSLLISTRPGLTVYSAKGKLYGQSVKFIAP